MRKITDFIINKRHLILVLFIVLTIISAILSSKVKINHDISKYMPDTSETSNLNMMFENLHDDEK